MIQKADTVLKDLKQKKYEKVYFLHGEESYYIDAISDYIEEDALSESEKSFNQIVMYGKDTSMQNILSQARRFPMMAKRQVLIVKEFQQLPDLAKSESVEIMLSYLAKPQPSTVLVFGHKHKFLNKNSKLYKGFNKHATVVESKKIYDNQVGSWIRQFVKAKNYDIQEEAIQLLADSIGADLGRLSTEVEKLSINVPKGNKINLKHIEDFVGISKDFNVFEFQNALAVKNHFKIVQILKYWEANPKKQPLIPTLALLYSFFTKLLIAFSTADKSDTGLAKAMKVSPFMVKNYRPAFKNYNFAKLMQCIHFLREADLQVKGIVAGANTENDILKELVYKILA